MRCDLVINGCSFDIQDDFLPVVGEEFDFFYSSAAYNGEVKIRIQVERIGEIESFGEVVRKVHCKQLQRRVYPFNTFNFYGVKPVKN
jgi:hypothetical protein